MKKKFENTEHIFNTQFDRLNYEVSLEDMLIDFKVLLKEYYCGTFTDEKNSIKITLNNGQKFLLNLKVI